MKYCEMHYRDIFQNEEGVLIINPMHIYMRLTELSDKISKGHGDGAPPPFFNLRCSTGIYLKVSFWRAL